jgi:hypothetical protein
MKTTITVSGLKELQRDLKKMSEEKAREVKKEVYASALDVQMAAKENLEEMGTWDTGNLANTILVDRVDNDQSAEIGSTAPYGPYVEHGTKPHFPPPDALEDWAKRHGFKSAWPICKAIAKRGLPENPFLFPAYLDVVKGFLERLKAIFKR